MEANFAITTDLTILLLSITVSLLLAIPIIKLLYHFNITRRGESDFSNLIEKRKLKIGVPVMGGLMIIATLILVNFLIGNISDRILVLLLIVLISGMLGGFDDVLNIYGHKRRVRTLAKVRKLIRVHAKPLVRLRLLILYPWHMYSRFFFMLGSNPGRGIHAHEKILVQVIAGGILAAWLAGQDLATKLWVPLVGEFELPLPVAVIFIILTTVLMTNAVNIADGLDGLSTTQLLNSIAGFGVIAAYVGDRELTSLLIVTVGALMGYLYFNIPPARVQMGDVGSLALGTLLAGVAFMLQVPLLLLLISLPFAVTLTSTVIQGLGRRILGRRIFRMAPIHHHFELIGWSEEKVVMRFALFSAVCAIVGLWVYFYSVEVLGI